MLNENELRVLQALEGRKDFVGAAEAAAAAQMNYHALMSVLAGLEQNGFVAARKQSSSFIQLTHEGKTYAEKGTPERRLAKAVKESGGNAVPLEKALEKAGLDAKEKPIALRWAKELKWIGIKPGAQSSVDLLNDEKNELEEALEEAAASETPLPTTRLGEKTLKTLLLRSLAKTVEEKSVLLKITVEGAKALKEAGAGAEKMVSQLTPEMLKLGTWKQHKFRPYDVRTVATPVSIGLKHYYKEFLDEIRHQLAGIGFKEVHGPLVETEFWNMDALYMAQDHPAREIHDIFHLEEPNAGHIADKELLKRVKQAHEEGAAGSKGWQYEWDPATAARLVMRSHTTPVSARNLEKGLKPPARLFCIGKVFRPDEIDWKHFIEFNQCEGIVADEAMNFRELLGYLKTFAIEIFGAEGVKFVPSYFPFTEPSVELHANIPGKGWAEVGGAGMFRPEMLEALGVDVPVLAWGLGIDRLAMIRLGVKDIRDLHSLDEKLLREASRG